MTLYPIYDADEIKYQVKECRMTQTHQSIESLQYYPTYYRIFSTPNTLSIVNGSKIKILPNKNTCV